VQVTIVGGGSYQWTPELLADLLGTECLHGARIVLEDVDPEPLPKMAALGERLNEAMGAGVSFATSTDQRQALEGADFVIVTISTGGFRSMSVDLDVPATHGIHQSVGDSVGPGGINRALRNIPVMVGIARDMEEVCGDAWLLNITNPMTTITRSVCRATGVPTVGLCHEVGNFTMDVAIATGNRWEDVRPTVVGVNHFPVVTALEVNGEDGFELLAKLIEEHGGLAAQFPGPGWELAEDFTPRQFLQRNLLKLTLFERFGAIPAAGDRHLAEFVPGILTEASDWGGRWNISLTPIATREEHQRGYVADVDAWLAGDKPLQTWSSGELPAPVIKALVTGERLEAPVNIPNAGQAPDLPAEAVVETMCVVDAEGIRGRDRATVPGPLAEILRRTVAVQELTVEAALAGDRHLVEAAFVLDPLAGRGDLEDTLAMAGELLAGTAEWLPPPTPAP
jgi:alpha-galactosidase